MLNDCLAATGLDASVPLMLGALLVLVGIGAAVVAFRRGSAGAALLIALVLVAVPLSFGGVSSSATAADECGADGQSAPAVVTPTAAPSESTPTCTPDTEEDVLFNGVNEGTYWSFEDGQAELVVEQDAAELIFAAVAPLMERQATPNSYEVAVHSYPEHVLLRTVPVTPLPTDGGFGYRLSDDDTDAVFGDDASLYLDTAVNFAYDDGCGDETSTLFTLQSALID